MTFRAFGITSSLLLLLLLFLLHLTSAVSSGAAAAGRKDLDHQDGVPGTGFGYELLIAKMEFLEQKISTLEATVTELKGKQTGMAEELVQVLRDEKCQCSGNASLDVVEEVERINSCSDVTPRSPGLVTVNPSGGDPFEVLCDFHDFGGGWTVIQHRFSGEVDFYRTWEEYKHGFGDLKGEFWLGLDKIHRITNSENFELIFVLVDRDLYQIFASYSLFRIGSEAESYRINQLGTYNGTAGDSFRYHEGMKFTTWDRKNDRIPGSANNCAVTFRGAWWYNNCQTSNLNGPYRRSTEGERESTCWNTHNPPKFPWCHGFSSTKIMVRRVK